MFGKKCCLILLLSFIFSMRNNPAAETGMKPVSTSGDDSVYVTLWFDTEDYILPASDDAALRLARFLTEEGIKATFKVVGEKARTLERRGRQDVIDALRRHDIGYHTDWHSTHPTPAERLSRMGWEEGIREFDLAERAGFDDVRRIFSQEPVCYGQPGSSWTPQAYAVLKRWGVGLYLDESQHLGLNQEPFWYGGMLNVLNLGKYVTRVELHRAEDLKTAQSKFEEISRDLQSRGGGLVSIYYHPCEFIHEEFWDAVNFGQGANPPRREWKLPPSKSPAAIEQGFRNFQDYVIFLKNRPEVKFVAGRDLLTLYPDRSLRKIFSKREILELAQAMQQEITFQRRADIVLSAAEVFSLLNRFLSAYLRERKIPEQGLFEFTSGPCRRPQESSAVGPIGGEQFSSSCLDVQNDLDSNHQIPAEIWVGANAVAPADYLATLSKVVVDLITKGQPSEFVPLQRGRFTADQYIADDSPSLWGWVIFPQGFHSPQIMEQAHLQAWTLKPAILKAR